MDSKKQKIIMTVGIPASGKSSWAKAQCEIQNWMRINKDDIRAQVFNNKWSREKEKLVNSIEESMCRDALYRGYNVIIDSTNFAPKHEKRFRRIAEEFGVEFEIKTFDVPVYECIRRDALREKPVGEKVIRQMYDQYIRPNLPKQDQSLTPCYIFDLDGTLAKMNGRSPFDWDKVGQDKVNEPVARFANILRADGNVIIVMTGRDGCCLDLCKKWLWDNKIHFDRIFIRPAGNSQKDSIIKRKMYEENVLGKYYVRGWFDDRDQVVEMIRDDLNLACFQVDWGNF